MTDFEATVPAVTDMTYAFLKDSVINSAIQVVGRVLRKGLIPTRCRWRVELAEDFSSISVSARSPGVYCLPGKKGCPDCGATYTIRMHRHDRQTCHIVCPNCGRIEEYMIPRYMAKNFIRV